VRGRLLRELRTPLPQAMRVAPVVHGLVRAGRDRIARASADVERLGAALALLNPEAVLDRGYAIVTAAGGGIVGDVRQIRVGEDVGLTFAIGSAVATVKATREPD
jgi:exodeoxyribonuclease VII large subunit